MVHGSKSVKTVQCSEVLNYGQSQSVRLDDSKNQSVKVDGPYAPKSTFYERVVFLTENQNKFRPMRMQQVAL